ncbi:hypothetical protein AJ80_03038 [Polytolypa hystricis UAMH7299]|uniref:Uncharacterized protein n=1 Tax=Polytolypa hystricis (strain UAMH7299) TaxID=1447883 RepID=A0A2B7YJV6_POLH7|nr:hypothetical protein AJ80_03038 [Polytolypa hystricis UAMH7299]
MSQLNQSNITIFRSQRQQTDVESSNCLEDSRNPYGPRKAKRMLFYRRQEMSDRQWKERLQRQSRLEKEREQREELELKAGDEGAVHDSENGIEDRTVKDEDKPIYVAYPKLNVALADFLPFDDPMHQQELTFDWDDLRSRVDNCKGDLALDRIEDAIEFLEKKGEEV